MKLTISIDVDDVLADFHKRFREIAHDLFPDRAPLPVSTGWDQPNWNLTLMQREILNEVWRSTPNIYEHLDVCAGVDKDFLKDLHRDCNLMFLSSRHENAVSDPAYQQTVGWLQERIGIPDPIVVIADAKVPVLRATQAILHVDDRWTTYATISTHLRGKTIPILMRHCQNMHVLPNITPHMPVAEDWTALMHYITTLRYIKDATVSPR